MDIRHRIQNQFHQQIYTDDSLDDLEVSCRTAARSYAWLENAIAVLSDLKQNRSVVYYGAIANELGLEVRMEPEYIFSIWEDKVYRLIHPDDLTRKHLNELRFYSFVRKQPVGRRRNFYVRQQIRMYRPDGSCIRMLHRMYYLWDKHCRNVRFALCVYTSDCNDADERSYVVDSLGTEWLVLDTCDRAAILTERERTVLQLIGRGMSSAEISGLLSISLHTVSRHRQNILDKLQVRNSVEACRVAREMKII